MGMVTVKLVVPVTPAMLAEIVAAPVAKALARPLAEMVAMSEAEEVQLAVEVTSAELPSVYVPTAEYCWDAPIGKSADDGETEIVVRAFGFTATASELEIPDNVAEIAVCPAARLVTSPPAETLATDVLDEVQVTVAVTSRVEPSLYFPVAVSCCVWPVFKVTDAGLTEMEERVVCEPPLIALLEPPPPHETRRSEDKIIPSEIATVEILWVFCICSSAKSRFKLGFVFCYMN